MPALNDEIDALDNKVAGEVQLELYAAVQDLLLDRLVWFLRNVDLTKGLAGVVEHYRDGIAAVAAALDTALPTEAAAARDARAAELVDGRRAGRARAPHRRACRRSRPRPTSCWSPSAPSKPIADVAATYFAAEAFFQLDRIVAAAREHRGVGLFRPAGARPRARLDRRRRAAADRGDGRRPAPPARRRSRPGSRRAQAEVERIRAAMHEIANPG